MQHAHLSHLNHAFNRVDGEPGLRSPIMSLCINDCWNVERDETELHVLTISFSFLFFQAKDQDSLSERMKTDKNYSPAACLLQVKILILLFVFKFWHKVGF